MQQKQEFMVIFSYYIQHALIVFRLDRIIVPLNYENKNSTT